MSNFPATSIDSFTTKVDNTTDVLAAHVNDLQSAVVAVQTKVGVDSSLVTTSLDYLRRNVPSTGFTIRDAGISITSADDGHLDFTADIGIDMNGVVNFTADTLLATTTKMQFRDADIYIQSADDGYLDLYANTAVRVNGAALGASAFHADSYFELTGVAATAIGVHAAVQSGVHGIAITAAKTLTVQKSMTLTSAGDSGVLTMPNGTDTIMGLGTTGTITGVYTLGTTTKLYFRDTGLYLYSSVNGQLDIIADTKMQITAPAIAMTGAVTITGALLATTYGGITAANIADITDTRSISGAWTWSGATKQYFRDSDIYIASNNDGYLDLYANTAIRFNNSMQAGGYGITGLYDLQPITDITNNIGAYGKAWNDVIADDFVNVSHSWFDEGVTITDDKGKKKLVSDLDGLMNMKPSEKINKKTGRPYIDKTSLPVEMVRHPDKKNREQLIEDGTDPDEIIGSSVTAIQSWLLGCMKEAKLEIDDLRSQIQVLKDRLSER